MPQRFLRPGFTNSERVNAVSWMAQALFIRLITVVDDYGRFDARPSVLVSAAFTIWNELHPEEPVTSDAVQMLLAELVASDLVLVYFVDDRPYLQLCQWTERRRCLSRCPPPPCDGGLLTAGCQQPDSSLTATCGQPDNILPQVDSKLLHSSSLVPRPSSLVQVQERALAPVNGSEVKASTVKFAALKAIIEKHPGRDRAQCTAAERDDYRKKCAELRAHQEAQAAGQFG